MEDFEKEFVPYPLALRLKALGFDEPCFGYWSNWGLQEPFLLTCELGTEKESCAIRRKNFLCSSPTFSQAFRWFREKYGLHPHIFSKEDGTFVWCVRWYIDGLQKDIPYESSNTYEEAELACLDKLIEIVERDKKWDQLKNSGLDEPLKEW